MHTKKAKKKQKRECARKGIQEQKSMQPSIYSAKEEKKECTSKHTHGGKVSGN